MRELIQNIINGNYILQEQDFVTYPELCRNPDVIKIAINQNPRFIRYFTPSRTLLPKNMIEDIYKLAIEKGFVPTDEDFRGLTELNRSQSMMETAIINNPEMVRYNMNYLDFALEHGLMINKQFLDKYPSLLKNEKVLRLAIDINPYYIDNVNFSSDISVDNLKYAISKGYIPSEGFISKVPNSELMKLCIDVNPSLIENYKKNHINEINIDEDLINYAINKGYVPTKEKISNNVYLSRSITITYYLLTKDSELINNKFLNDYINKSSIKGLNFEIINNIWPFVGNNAIYDAFDYNEILKIVKYVYCGAEKKYDLAGHYMSGHDIEYFPQLKQNFESIINSGRVKQFGDILKLIANDYDFKDRLILINSISQNFLGYENMLNNFFENNYNLKDVYLLKNILLSNEKVDGILSIDDLRKYDEKIYTRRLNSINNINISSDTINITDNTYFYRNKQFDLEDELCVPDELYEKIPSEFIKTNKSVVLMQNIILKMLCNMSYSKYLNEVFNGFSSNDINALINHISDEKTREELQNYKIVIEFIESILKCEDFNELKNIALNLNNSIYKNSDAVIPIYETLSQLSTIKKEFYGKEISENITTLSEITPNSDKVDKNDPNIKYIRENAKFTASNKQIYGKEINGKQVDFIEFTGQDFVLFTHVMNAYGDGSTLEDFNQSRLIGKTYICLSAIDDYNFSRPEDRIDKEYDGESEEEDFTENYNEDKLNYVTLVFDNFKNEQLIFMAPNDIYSDGNQNSLDVTSGRTPMYMPIRELIKDIDDDQYSEYVFYREDKEGKSIYPSGVLIRENPPTQYEIDAAAYLNVPLVYINEDAYDMDNVDKIQREEKETNVSDIPSQNNQIIDMLNQLKASINQGVDDDMQQSIHMR